MFYVYTYKPTFALRPLHTFLHTHCARKLCHYLGSDTLGDRYSSLKETEGHLGLPALRCFLSCIACKSGHDSSVTRSFLLCASSVVVHRLKASCLAMSLRACCDMLCCDMCLLACRCFRSCLTVSCTMIHLQPEALT